MPDGTSVGGIPSTLFQTLNARFSTASWEQQFQKAAAVWEQVANINLAQVSDNGSPVGTSGNQQDDPRFGDIRIGAIPEQGQGQLAYAFLPPPINGGTAAGDIMINSTTSWQINSDFDLETIAIHEIGHALGMGHSATTYADMYAYYNGIKQTLTSEDANGLQSVYGAQPGAGANTSSSTATNITASLSNNQIAIPGLVNPTYSAQEWYKVTVPSTTTGTMTVTMQTSNLSSLCPRVTVFNAKLTGLGQALAANVYGATVSYTVTNVAPGQVYYIRATAANNGAGAAGTYGLVVNFASSPQAVIAPPNTAIAQQPDQGGGSSSMTSSSGGSSGGGGSGGGLLGGLVGGLLGTVEGLLGIVHLQIGTLSVWGEALTAGPRFQGHPHPGHHAQHFQGHAPRAVHHPTIG